MAWMKLLLYKLLNISGRVGDEFQRQSLKCNLFVSAQCAVYERVKKTCSHSFWMTSAQDGLTWFVKEY